MEKLIVAHDAADRQLIEDVIAKYAWGYDSPDFALLAESFTEDAISRGVVANGGSVWGPIQGRAEIVKTLASIRNKQTDQRRHNIGTFLFERQAAASATVKCYLNLTSTEDGVCRVVSGGAYFAELVKQNDTWRIARLDARLDGPF